MVNCLNISATGKHEIIAKATDNGGNQQWANIPPIVVVFVELPSITVEPASGGNGIQKAIDKLAAKGGGMVYLKSGTYRRGRQKTTGFNQWMNAALVL
jgi:hypothetical protein